MRTNRAECWQVVRTDYEYTQPRTFATEDAAQHHAAGLNALPSVARYRVAHLVEVGAASVSAPSISIAPHRGER